MQLTVTTNEGNIFSVDVDPSITIDDLKATLEPDCHLKPEEQELFYLGKQLDDGSKSLEAYEVNENEVILLTRKPTVGSVGGGSGAVGGRSFEQDAENLRQQVLGDPNMQASLRASNPAFLQALDNPAAFRSMLSNLRNLQQSASLSRQHNEDILSFDPYDIEAQRRIEEAIRQEAIAENFENAMEFSPESFGRVTMLYIDGEVNGKKVKAFVDSGAQATIMSARLAEQVGIARLIDRRFAGIAKGVGSAPILGRIHSAMIKLGDLFLHCSLTVIDQGGVEFLFGLDMLKRHQAILDMGQNCMIIQGQKIPFLAEHELPESAKMFEGAESSSPGQSISPRVGGSSLPNPAPQASTSATRFPGSGSTLSSSNPSSRPPAPSTGPVSDSRSQFSEDKIQSLVALGVNRNEAIELLRQTNGDPDMAASLLFSQFS